MNKKELIEALKEFPDDTIICVYQFSVPLEGLYEITSIKDHDSIAVELVRAED